MEYIAQTKGIRISPRKVRLVADAIRGMSIEKALRVLSLAEKRGAKVLEKTLKSAVANAVNNKNVAAESLTIAAIEIGEGQALKRYHPSTRGRVHTYKRRASNVRIVLKTRPASVKTSAGEEGEK